MCFHRRWLAISLCLFIGGVAAHSEVVTIDLAQSGKTDAIDVERGALEVQLTNAMPGEAYELAWSLSSQTYPPLTYIQQVFPQASDSCDALKARLALASIPVTSEEGVAAWREGLAKDAQSCKANLPADFQLLSARLSALQEAFERPAIQVGGRALHYGEDVVVTVHRLSAGKIARTWSRTYRTPAAGAWLSTYGFIFSRNGDRSYFAESLPDQAAKFQIKRKTDNEDLDFVPGIFYSFFPRNWRVNSWFAIGPSAGLGYDGSEVNLFAGFAFAVADNVMLQGGVLVHRETRLNGKYGGDPLPTISEQLSEDQLIEKTYATAPYLGISFRFGTNPFETKKEEKSASPAK